MAITPNSASVTGVDMTETAATDPLKVTNNGRVLLVAINSSGATRTFDIVTEAVEETDLAIADRSITLGASDEYTLLGTYSTALYNDSSNEISLENFNSTAGVSFLAIQT